MSAPPASPDNIGRKMSLGAAWMLLFKLCERGLGLVSTLVLVRVLSPEDFGVVAMAMSFIALAELVSAFGFDMTLIQKQQAEERHYHVAWTCNLLLGLGVMAVMLAAASPIAEFYRRPEVFWVVCALALGPAIGGAQNIGVVAFRKELDFRKEFRFQLSRKLIAVAITVPLALWWRSYWALVVGMLFSRLAGTVISYLVHPFRPRPMLSRVRELMSFSGWIFANNVVLAAKERATDFVIGSNQGPHALGLYNIANEFASLPQTELAAPVNRALFPSFATVQHDPVGVRRAFLSAFGLLGLLVIAAATVIYCIAPFLVPVMFGPKWQDAAPVLQILTLAGVLIGLHSPLCSILFARGAPSRVVAAHAAFVLVMIVGLCWLMPPMGVNGAALAVLLAAVLSTPAYVHPAMRALEIPFVALAGTVVRPLLAGALTMVTLGASGLFGAPRSGLLANLLPLAGTLIGAMILFAGFLLALWALARKPQGAELLALAALRRLVVRR